MSDFKNIQDFRKSKSSKFQFQDPTYLSFVILFDFSDAVNSPLLTAPAENFLQKLSAGNTTEGKEVGSYYKEKLEALQNFKKALKVINNEMPWYWQGFAGLENILKWDPAVPYRGGTDAQLTISTLESINLPITGLMHLYRKAVFDERKWTWVLPANLRKFRMYVYVTEVRTIGSGVNPRLTGISATEFKPSISFRDTNSIISGPNNRPYFMFGLRFCEFDMQSGSDTFADLKKTPEGAAVSDIKISYEVLQNVDARVLNGIVEKSGFDNDKLSPAPDGEGKGPNDLLSFAKAQGAQFLKDAATRGYTDMRNLSVQRVNEISERLKFSTITRARADVNNAYSDFIRGIDNSGDLGRQIQNVGASINENVYGLTGGNANIGAALNAAAINSLGNIYDGN